MDKNTVYWGNALKNPKYNKPKADTESLKVDGINDEVPLGQTMSGLDSSLESAAHADRLNRLQGRGMAMLLNKRMMGLIPYLVEMPES